MKFPQCLIKLVSSKDVMNNVCNMNNFTNFLFSFLGVILITLALCADAMIGNVQEKAMKSYSSTNTEVVSSIIPQLLLLIVGPN